MPISWATLFRSLVLFALTAHEFVMYNLAREFSDSPKNSAGDVVLAALFALVMLIPLVWAVTLPELPEIYTRVVRAKRWFAHGRCPSCGYVIGNNAFKLCPECGSTFEAPREYAVTKATIWRYVFFNLSAWVLGCTLGELAIRFLPGGSQ